MKEILNPFNLRAKQLYIISEPGATKYEVLYLSLTFGAFLVPPLIYLTENRDSFGANDHVTGDSIW